MWSPSRALSTPTTAAWRELLEGEPSDEQTRPGRVSSSKPKVAQKKSSWWNDFLPEPPSDLEASSFIDDDIGFDTRDESDEVKRGSRSEVKRPSRLDEAKVVALRRQKSITNSRKYHKPLDLEAEKSFLDFLVCSFDTLESPTLRKIEETLTDSFMDDEDGDTTTGPSMLSEFTNESSIISSSPPSPPRHRTDSFDEIFNDLNNMPGFETRDKNRPTSTKKYKQILKQSVKGNEQPTPGVIGVQRGKQIPKQTGEGKKQLTPGASRVFSRTRYYCEGSAIEEKTMKVSFRKGPPSVFSSAKNQPLRPAFNESIRPDFQSSVPGVRSAARKETREPQALSSKTKDGSNHTASMSSDIERSSHSLESQKFSAKKTEVVGGLSSSGECDSNGVGEVDLAKKDASSSAMPMMTKTNTSNENSEPKADRDENVELVSDTPTISGLTTSSEEHSRKMKGKFASDPIIGSKSCIPNFKKLSLHKSTSASSSRSTAKTVPVVKIVSSSASGTCTTFTYDHGSEIHAYSAYFRRGYKATECMRVYEHVKPKIFPTLDSEVVIEVEVSTVSRSDNAIRRGIWWGETSKKALSLPIVPGVAFVGKVVQLSGKGTRSGLKEGDRVSSLVRVGANSRHLCIGHDRLVKVPSKITDDGAIACIPEAYLAAFQALHFGSKSGLRYRKNSLAGQSVLVLGGATTYGRALIEVALAGGAGPVYGTGRERHFPLISEVGAIPLGSDPHHWYSMVAGKMDFVISTEDGSVPSHIQYEHIKSINENGTLIIFRGPDTEEENVLNLDQIDSQSVPTNRKLLYFNIFDSWEAEMKQAKRDLTHLLKLLSEKRLNPRILDRIPLSKVARAHDLLEVKNLNGFLLCEPWLKARKDAPKSAANKYGADHDLLSFDSSIESRNLMQF